MADVVIAALAGFGISVAVGRSAARLERWWEPTWQATRRGFAWLRSTNLAAFAAGVLGAASTGSLLSAAAAGALAGALAEGALLLLVRSRT